jgi:3-methylcrotonyl-CoA carboxylase beta subunit
LTSSVVETKVKRNSPDFEKNTRRMVDLLTEIKNQETAIQLGGGAKAVEAQHKKSRLTARERIAKLIDPHTSFFELGIYAAHGMYEEWGGAPAAGAITGLGRICGRLVTIIANDATV